MVRHEVIETSLLDWKSSVPPQHLWRFLVFLKLPMPMQDYASLRAGAIYLLCRTPVYEKLG